MSAYIGQVPGQRVDTNGETKGSLRTLRLIGGAKLVERLEEVSPTERLYRYSITYLTALFGLIVLDVFLYFPL